MLQRGKIRRRFSAPSSLVCVLIAAFGLCALEGIALCQASPRDLDELSKASVVFIATVRKDGNQSTSAPVWFTVTPERLLLIQTQPTSWKAKRIRRGSPAIVWIGSKDGPAFIAKAVISGDPAVLHRIIEDYPQRYLMARLGFHRPTQERFDKGQIVAIEITPVRDLPAGFASAPGTPAPSLDGEHAGAADSPAQHQPAGN